MVNVNGLSNVDYSMERRFIWNRKRKYLNLLMVHIKNRIVGELIWIGMVAYFSTFHLNSALLKVTRYDICRPYQCGFSFIHNQWKSNYFQSNWSTVNTKYYTNWNVLREKYIFAFCRYSYNSTRSLHISLWNRIAK